MPAASQQVSYSVSPPSFSFHIFVAVMGGFVHAHAVVVDSVRFAAFIAVSPVTPGTNIDNSGSGIMQLRECQCIRSARFGCVIVGSAVIDCRFSFFKQHQAPVTNIPYGRGCVWNRCPKGARAIYCPPSFFTDRLATIDRCKYPTQTMSGRSPFCAVCFSFANTINC